VDSSSLKFAQKSVFFITMLRLIYVIYLFKNDLCFKLNCNCNAFNCSCTRSTDLRNGYYNSQYVLVSDYPTNYWLAEIFTLRQLYEYRTVCHKVFL
jgi:hypothetical protein